MDDLIQKHGVGGPFLEAGCGMGFNSVHLARRGWTGVALDVSEQAIEDARSILKDWPGVQVINGPLEKYEGGPFGTVLMLDVLEHLPDDYGALMAARRTTRPGGHLFLAVPTNPGREWRWDDDAYGHIRRYDPPALEVLLGRCGYTVVEMRDLTFPVLWLLRRGYTRLKRPLAAAGTAEVRTRNSSRTQPWEMGILSTALARLAPWRTILGLQRPFRKRTDIGHEMLLLARLGAADPV
jgi:SAM-dependent methyltransferase